MSEQKARRQRRTKANILASIEQAAMSEIAQNGFVSSLVTNIIRSAKIEPQVFYNRYKDINEFYDAFVRRYDSYINRVLNKVDDPVVSQQGITALLQEILHTINEDPVVLELLRWEISDKNKSTMRSSMLRELNFQPVIQGFLRCFKDSNVDIVGVFAILVGGIYYLSLHQKLGAFHGISFDSDSENDDRFARMDKLVEYMVSLVFESRNQNLRELEIAERLRRSGVSEEVIARALAPSTTIHTTACVKDRFRTDE